MDDEQPKNTYNPEQLAADSPPTTKPKSLEKTFKQNSRSSYKTRGHTRTSANFNGPRSKPHENNNSFVVAYTSLSIILLAFFIYLNTLTQPDVVRKKEVINSLAKHFTRGPHLESKQQPEPSSSYDMPIPELAISFPKMSFTTRYSNIINAAENGQLETIQRDDSLLITIPGAQLFDVGNDQLKPAFIPVLRKVIQEIISQDLIVEIEGHTDSRPISSPRFPSNWELSVARAVSVLRFFMDEGASSEILSAAGRAEHVPVASNETTEGRSKNRRVVLIIKEPPPPDLKAQESRQL